MKNERKTVMGNVEQIAAQDEITIKREFVKISRFTQLQRNSLIASTIIICFLSSYL